MKEKETKNNEKIYEIYLLYLGKYLNFIEDDEKINQNENIIEECQFKTQLMQSGLVKEEKIKNISYKILYNKFKTYENEIKINQINKKIINSQGIKLSNTEKNKIEEMERKNIEIEEENMNNNINENQIKNDSYIIGEILITSLNKDKYIKIINSYENVAKEKPSILRKYGNYYSNEEEIKKNLTIKINGKKIDFTYEYVFPKEGKFKIEYLFINYMTKIDYLFYGCKSLINIDLSNFNTQNITDMQYFFSDCESLTNIDLSNLNTQNVINMQYMFSGCKSLTHIDLSYFNTQNVINMECLFFGCESLTNIDLSYFNTQNVTNMQYMFWGCKSLTYINLSNFNTQNVTNMECMFYGCESLINIDLSNFNTQSVTNMQYMLWECKSLKNFKTNDDNLKNLYTRICKYIN